MNQIEYKIHMKPDVWQLMSDTDFRVEFIDPIEKEMEEKHGTFKIYSYYCWYDYPDLYFTIIYESSDKSMKKYEKIYLKESKAND